MRMNQDCLPGHDLKATYQRNMLCSLALTCVMSVAAAVLILLVHPSPPSPHPTGPFRQVGRPDDPNPAGGKAAPTRLAGMTPRGLNPYASEHQGFLGFRRLNMVAEQSAVPNVARPRGAGIQAAGPVVDSFGPGGGGDGEGGYLPMVEDYFFPTDSATSTTAQAGGDRDIQVLTKVDPEYPIVALERRREGRIAVLVFVDADGRLSTFPDWIQGERRSLRYSFDGVDGTLEYAMTEDPADWFFGANFLKVLPQWQFVPRIEDGEPVGAMLIIKYTFSLVTNRDNVELVPVPGQ